MVSSLLCDAGETKGGALLGVPGGIVVGEVHEVRLAHVSGEAAQLPVGAQVAALGDLAQLSLLEDLRVFESISR